MFKLSAVTPEKVVFEQDVSSIIAPGIEGYLGVLTNHAPIITPLAAGRFDVKDPSGKQTEYFISGGFLEVSNNVATVLADAIENPAEIDIERAKTAEQRARDRLARRSSPDIDEARAETALKRALWRQKLAGR